MGEILSTIIFIIIFSWCSFFMQGDRDYATQSQALTNIVYRYTQAAGKHGALNDTIYDELERSINLYGDYTITPIAEKLDASGVVRLEGNSVIGYDLRANDYDILSIYVESNHQHWLHAFLNFFSADDNWVVDEEFILTYKGKRYLFTLSDEVKDMSTQKWLKASDIGLSEIERQTLVSTFIEDTIEDYLNNRSSKAEAGYYTLSLGLNDLDKTRKKVGGSNVIVLAEGFPLLSLNCFNPKERFYAYSMGGQKW